MQEFTHRGSVLNTPGKSFFKQGARKTVVRENLRNGNGDRVSPGRRAGILENSNMRKIRRFYEGDDLESLTRRYIAEVPEGSMRFMYRQQAPIPERHLMEKMRYFYLGYNYEINTHNFMRFENVESDDKI